MASDHWSISWNEVVVGWIESPDYDFPHCYGHWKPAGIKATTDFLAALRQAVNQDEEGLEVLVNDTMPGVIYDHPDDNDGEINIRTRG